MLELSSKIEKITGKRTALTYLPAEISEESIPSTL
jgi:hypothetical protein